MSESGGRGNPRGDATLLRAPPPCRLHASAGCVATAVTEGLSDMGPDRLEMRQHAYRALGGGHPPIGSGPVGGPSASHSNGRMARAARPLNASSRANRGRLDRLQPLNP